MTKELFYGTKSAIGEGDKKHSVLPRQAGFAILEKWQVL